MEILEDATGKLGIDDVSSTTFNSGFKPVTRDHITGFAGKGAVWVRFTLRSDVPTPVIWFLEITPAYNELLELYETGSPGRTERHIGGTLLPLSQREEAHRVDLFRLSLPPDQPRTMYLRIVSHRTIYSHLTLWQPDSFRKAAVKDALIHGAYLGIVLLIVCIYLLYWTRLKQPLYLFYSLYVLSIAFLFIDYYGYLHQFVITDRTWLLSPLVRLNLTLMLAANTGIFSHLLNLRICLPRLGKLYCVCCYGCAVSFALLSLAGLSNFIIIPVLVCILLAAIVTLPISLFLAFKRIPGAAMYLAAFGPFILIGCFRTLTFFDVIQEIFSADLFCFSSLAHIIIMSIIVTNQISKVTPPCR